MQGVLGSEGLRADDGLHGRTAAARAATHAARERDRCRDVVVRAGLRRAAGRRVPCLLMEESILANASLPEVQQLPQQTTSKPEAPDPNHQPLRSVHFQRVSVRVIRCVLCDVTQQFRPK